MVDALKIEEECRRRARINYENNKAWGRKGKEWALKAEHDWQAAEAIADLLHQLAEVRAERDEYLEELGEVIMACPMSPKYRTSPANSGVRALRSDFEAAEKEVERKDAENAVLTNRAVCLRENLRDTMLVQNTSGRRETYADGFHQGLCHALQKIDLFLGNAALGEWP